MTPQEFYELFAQDTVLALIRAVLMVIAGLAIATVSGRVFKRFAENRLSTHQIFFSRRLVFYGILGLFVASALNELGFSLAILMGAAGVLTVALGFASQTSASNLISGLFLIGEKPFEVGDIIRVGQTTGEVLSIDALSVKLRTFDNLFVRIPNETLIKGEVTTLTRFPIRRLDLMVGVAYKEDIGEVRRVLFSVAEGNLFCLDDPAPLFIFTGFGDSSLDIQFSVWARRQNFVALRNSITEDIKNAFDDAGIEIPFPHRSLYAGEATGPFPVTLVNPAGSDTDSPETGVDPKQEDP